MNAVTAGKLPKTVDKKASQSGAPITEVQCTVTRHAGGKINTRMKPNRQRKDEKIRKKSKLLSAADFYQQT